MRREDEAYCSHVIEGRIVSTLTQDWERGTGVLIWSELKFK